MPCIYGIDVNMSIILPKVNIIVRIINSYYRNISHTRMCNHSVITQCVIIQGRMAHHFHTFEDQNKIENKLNKIEFREFKAA